MGNIKEINIKNRTNYFFNDMINIKDFDWSLLKKDKKTNKNIGICNIGYITIKKLLIMKIFIVIIFSIGWLVKLMDIFKKKWK